ncbi:ABC transporter permease [Streptomyces griseoviridis]|uniref:Transport permease protein n=3 Tax=Streptomyces TaxID=1883 RepID=A0ABT9LEJ4_STRGD|nr:MULTISPECIES: ABC transporter permease [Streptomyces]MDP9682133.1 teichoic acid transport system permease protein [Streptomyces griseoviridis]GGS65347.1 transport permease protein [Streptomyces niveoruber]GGT18973.1 transport permease protein [Streptomyces griseoviridis]GGU65132.1 transport permease protein [Streptomyces daghestanicus]GHI33865.1 transport permease protein [Streptomyces daghestanicus]
MSQVLHTPPPTTTAAPAAEDLAALAARHGLSVSGARPSLPAYVRQLWARRHFIGAFSTAKLTAQYSQAKLGQVWQVMTPLLNAAVYFLIFGVLLQTKKGVPDYVPFLVTGVFIWTFTQSSIMSGTRAISGNLGLVRALHFPRAALPVSFCLQQLKQLLYSMAALVVILLAFGVPPAPSWVLAIPALVLQFTFNAGVAMIMARLGSKIPDIAQLMPFALRTWMYVSGVMWSIDHLISKHGDLPSWVGPVLQANPAAVYIDLMRFALIDTFHASQLPSHVWLLALGWALLAGIGGFIYFWKAEETYGRG